MPFEIVKTTLGMFSIKDMDTGEIMHNPVGPWDESRALYADQSELQRRLTLDTDSPLVLFDVGLGASFNALAAISKFEELQRARPLQIISFEKNLTLLKYAISQIDHFPQFAKYRSILEDLLENGKVVSGRLKWEIRHGEFRDLIQSENEIPEIIFFDPYSPKMNADMWTVEVFESLYNLARKSRFPSVLITYSVSTGIRTGLFLAGFYVGAGVGSGLKTETTFASTSLSEVAQPLGQRWFERLKRSRTPLPPHYAHTFETALAKLVEHPQWPALDFKPSNT